MRKIFIIIEIVFLLFISACQKESLLEPIISIEQPKELFSSDYNLELNITIKGIQNINKYEYGILYRSKSYSYDLTAPEIEYKYSKRITCNNATDNSFTLQAYFQPNDSMYYFCAYIDIDGQYYYSDIVHHSFSALEISYFYPSQISDEDTLELTFNKSIINISEQNSLKVFFNDEEADILSLQSYSLSLLINKTNHFPDSNFVTIQINDLVIKEFIPECRLKLISQYSNFPQEMHYYTLFQNGEKIYLGGSYLGDGNYKDYYVFNSSNSSWSVIHNFPYETNFTNIGFTIDGYSYVGNPFQLCLFDPTDNTWNIINESWDELPNSTWPESRWRFAVVGSVYQNRFFMATWLFSEYNFYVFNSDNYSWNKLPDYPTEGTSASRGETSFILNGQFYNMTSNDLYCYNISSESWHKELESSSDFFRIGGSYVFSGAAFVIARGCHESGNAGYCSLDLNYKIWKYNSLNKSYSFYYETVISDMVVGSFKIDSNVYIITHKNEIISIYQMTL